MQEKRRGVQQGGISPAESQHRLKEKKKYTIGTRPHACTHPMLSVSTAVNKRARQTKRPDN